MLEEERVSVRTRGEVTVRADRRAQNFSARLVPGMMLPPFHPAFLSTKNKDVNGGGGAAFSGFVQQKKPL